MNKTDHRQDIFIGNDCLSLIFALIDLKTTRNIKLSSISPRPDQSEFSPLWLEKINTFDLEFLKALGERYDIRTLRNIDSFTKSINERFSFAGKDLYFTQNPYANFLSLQRHLFDLLDFSLVKLLIDLNEDSFNQEINRYVQDTVKKIFWKKSNAFTCSYTINKLFDLFAYEFFKKSSDSIKDFYNILQVTYSSHLSSKIADDELKYLLCSLLLPAYKLNLDSLEKALSAELLMYSAKRIRDKRASDKPSELEDIFDPELKLGKIFDFSSSELITPKSSLTFLSLDFKINIEDCPIRMNEFFTFADTGFSSGDTPYIIFDLKDDEIIGHVLYQEHKATRPEFYFINVQRIIETVLSDHYPRLRAFSLKERIILKGGGKKWIYNNDLYPENSNAIYTVPDKKLLMGQSSQKKLVINKFSYLRMGIMGYFLLD